MAKQETRVVGRIARMFSRSRGDTISLAIQLKEAGLNGGRWKSELKESGLEELNNMARRRHPNLEDPDVVGVLEMADSVSQI